jgi:hypothetical protein
MNIDVISCGQGAPSLALILVSKHMNVFNSDVLIVADTGNENDMLWSNGKRTSAKEFFMKVTKKLSEKFGLKAYFVRSVDKNGNPLPPLMETQSLNNYDIPLYGSNGGQARQKCTSKYKISAVRQHLRRLGAKTSTTHLGITLDEVHRMNQSDVKWNPKHYPLVMDCKPPMRKSDCINLLNEFDIPYLVSSECDFCPHKNLWRWENSSNETIQKAIKFEESFNGEFFLNDKRVPLGNAIEKMRIQKPSQTLFDMCDSGYCFT